MAGCCCFGSLLSSLYTEPRDVALLSLELAEIHLPLPVTAGVKGRRHIWLLCCFFESRSYCVTQVRLELLTLLPLPCSSGKTVLKESDNTSCLCQVKPCELRPLPLRSPVHALSGIPRQGRRALCISISWVFLNWIVSVVAGYSFLFLC